MQRGLFDKENRLEKLSKLGDSLVRLNKAIDCERFRPTLATSANVHDSQVLSELVDDADFVLYADSAYYGESIFSALPEKLELRVHEKGSRKHPLTEEQKACNQEKSRIPVRIEHIFVFMINSMAGITVRSIGKLRAKLHAGITNLVYNICRYEFLC